MSPPARAAHSAAADCERQRTLLLWIAKSVDAQREVRPLKDRSLRDVCETLMHGKGEQLHALVTAARE